jgi:hypothetical protein
MISSTRISIRLIDSNLFLKKISVVFIATIILVPLVYNKLYIPAGLYLATLLVLHFVFFYTYFSQIAWRHLIEQRVGFAIRLLSLALFIYLLAVLKFHGSFEFVLLNLVAGLAIHTAILFSLMADIRLKPSI